MHPEDPQLLAQLETATAKDVPAGVPIDAKTESLRESWLGLAQLLQTTEEPLDAATAARLRRTTHNAVAPKRQTAAQRRPTAAMLASLVAAALLAAIVVWTTSHFGQDSSAEVDTIAKQESSPPPHRAELGHPNASPLPHDLPEPRDDAGAAASRMASPVDEPSELFSWDDSFDAQLARADQQFDTLVHTWRSDDVRYYTIEQQVRELEAELSRESL